MVAKSVGVLGGCLNKQVAKLLPGLSHHAVAYDQTVAVLRVALKTQEADRLSFRERDRLAEVEQGLWLLHMLLEDALEGFRVPRACRIAPALRGAEPAQVPIGDPGFGEMGREL